MDILHRQAAGRQKQSDKPKHIATHCNEAMSRDAAMSQRFGLKNQRQPPASTSTSTLVLTRVNHTVAASHTTALKTRTRGTPTQEQRLHAPYAPTSSVFSHALSLSGRRRALLGRHKGSVVITHTHITI